MQGSLFNSRCLEVKQTTKRAFKSISVLWARGSIVDWHGPMQVLRGGKQSTVHQSPDGLEKKKKSFNNRTVYLERTALIFNHVRLCVSSRKDTNCKEMLASLAPLPGGEQPCFTAETKPCNVRYLETVIGWPGLISAVADSLRGRFQLTDWREKR